MSTNTRVILRVGGPKEMAQALRAHALKLEAGAKIPAETFEYTRIADTGRYQQIRLSSSSTRYLPALERLLDSKEPREVARHLVVRSSMIFNASPYCEFVFVNGSLVTRDSKIEGTLFEGEVSIPDKVSASIVRGWDYPLI